MPRKKVEVNEETSENIVKATVQEEIKQPELEVTEAAQEQEIIDAELEQNVDSVETNVDAELLEQPEPKKPERKNTEVKQNVGVLSSEIIDSDRYKPHEKQDKLLEQLCIYQKDKTVLWGEVIGLVYSEAFKSSVVYVLWNGINILVPVKEYFEDTFKFSANFDSLSDKDKDNQMKKLLKFQIGSRVCVIVSAAVKTNVEVGEKANNQCPFVITAVGSRRQAMETLRNIWFIHKSNNEKIKAQFKETPIKGDICKANVLSVRNDSVIVECLGVETRVDAFDLSDLAVENCRDFVQPGDTIKVRIKKLYINEGDKIYLSVSGRLNDTEKVLNTMQVGSFYLGKVDRFNKERHVYLIHLRNGVNALVPPEDVESKTYLFNGETVTVEVTKIKDTYVVGKALKI